MSIMAIAVFHTLSGEFRMGTTGTRVVVPAENIFFSFLKGKLWGSSPHHFDFQFDNSFGG